MTIRIGAGFALAALVVALPAAAADNPFTPEVNAERRAARGLEPAVLEPAWSLARGDPAVVRLRFYADADYRAGLVRWQDRIRAQLVHLNGFVERALGVRLEAESFRRWDHQAPGSDIRAMADELERHDPGLDVDWVVGLVTPLPLVTSSIHELGMARVLGRHFVVRAMASTDEARALERNFARMDPAEREALYSRRKWHRETAIFLHEWFHTLGAVHSSDPGRIMHPAYSERMRDLGAEDTAVVAAGLRARLDGRGQERIDWTALRTALARPAPADWDTRERDQVLASLGSGATTATTGAGAQIPLREEDVEAYNRTLALAKAAGAAIDAKDWTEAHARVAEAARWAGKMRAPHPEPWLWLASLDVRLGALADAEDALGRAGAAPDADKVRRDLGRARRMLGLPADGSFAVAREREPELAGRQRDIVRALDHGDLGKARDLVAAALAAFPGAPVFLGLACETEMRARRPHDAERRCLEAVRALPTFGEAHYLLGHARLLRGAFPGAVGSLRRAAALDPEDRRPWRTLGEAYRAWGRRRDLAALRAEYQKAFGEPLP